MTLSPRPKKAVHVLDVRQLPPHLRDRLATSFSGLGAPIPLVAHRIRLFGNTKIWGAVIALGVLGTLSISALGFGDLYSGFLAMPWSLAPALSGTIALIALGILGIWNVRRLRGGAPYLPGKLLFPLDFVEASGPRLKVRSLAGLTAASIRKDKQGRDELVLSFDGGATESIAVGPEDRSRLRDLALSTRGASSDPNALFASHVKSEIDRALALRLPEDKALFDVVDPFLELREEGSWAQYGPSTGADNVNPTAPIGVPVLIVAALIVGALLGPAALMGRNRLSDDAAFAYASQPDGGPLKTFGTVEERLSQYEAAGGRRLDEVDTLRFERAKTDSVRLAVYLQTGRLHVAEADEALFDLAKQEGTPDAYRRYLEKGKAHADEVTGTLLPAAELAHARRDGSIQALRSFLRAHPTGPLAEEAKQAVSARYAAARDLNKAPRGKRDADMEAFYAKLIDHLEKQGATGVAVSFKQVDAEALRAADEILRATKENKYPYASAFHFYTEKYFREIEQILFEKVSLVVGESVPYDVARLHPAEPEDVNLPTITVDYRVKAAGIYTSEMKRRTLLAVLWYFTLSFRIPGEAEERTLELTLDPPEGVNIKDVVPLPSADARERRVLPPPTSSYDIYKEIGAGTADGFQARLAERW